MLPFPIINNLRVKPSNPGIKRLTSYNNNGVMLQYNSGDTYALGANASGQLGTGNTTAVSAWTLLKSNVRLFCPGPSYTILVTNDNLVYGAGNIGYVFSGAGTSTTFVDITSRFSSFDIGSIVSITGGNDSARLFLVDGTNKLWGIGSNQYNALGTGSSTAGVSTWTALTNGTNVKKVQCGMAGTWIFKNDGTIWRTGTNTYRTLLDSSNTTVFTTFSQYTGFSTLDINCTEYNTTFLLSDGTIRIIGNGGNGQLGNGSTGTAWQASAYNPGLTSCTKLMESNSLYTTMVLSGTGLYSAGDNTSGKLGTGSGSNPISSFTKGTGSIASQNVGSIQTFCSINNAAYYVYDNKVYASGSGAMILGASRTAFAVMPTPYN